MFLAIYPKFEYFENFDTYLVATKKDYGPTSCCSLVAAAVAESVPLDSSLPASPFFVSSAIANSLFTLILLF